MQKMGWTGLTIFVAFSILVLSTHQAFPGSQADLRWSKDMTAQYERILKRVPPTKKGVVTDAVKNFENQISSSQERDLDYYALLEKTIRSFALGGLAQMGVDEAAFLVMMMAVEDMDDDIRMIMNAIKAKNQAKQRLRELIKELNERISNEMGNITDGEDIDIEKVHGEGSNQDTTERIIPNQMGNKIPNVMTTPNYRVEYFKAPVVKQIPNLGKMSANEARKVLREKEKDVAAMERRLVIMNESVRLLLDRRSRFIQILSDLLKEMSTTNGKPSENSKNGKL